MLLVDSTIAKLYRMFLSLLVRFKTLSMEYGSSQYLS